MRKPLLALAALLMLALAGCSGGGEGGGASPSAASYRLRRAEAKLIGAYLDAA